MGLIFISEMIFLLNMPIFDFFSDIISNPLFIMSVVFWIVSFILVQLFSKRKDTITLLFPLLAMFRTKKLNQLLKRVAKRSPKFWRWVFNVGIFVSFGFTVYGIWFLVSNLFQLFTSPSIENAITPLIPGVTVDFPMFSYFIIPLLIIISVHEFSHAMAAEADGIEVKSTGILGAGPFFVVLYGAFVEIDEFATKSRKVSPWTRLRIAGAGTFSNAILAVIGLILVLNIVPIISIGYGPEVFQVSTVLTDTQGGYNSGSIFPGDVVLSINGTSIDVMNGYDLTAILQNETAIQCSIGDTLNITVLGNDGLNHQRIVVLGHHFFTGIQYKSINATHIQIISVYSKLSGGNNYNSLIPGQIIKSIDGYEFNSTEDRTLGAYLRSIDSERIVNMTTDTDTNISININYYPTVAGAFEFQSFYIGGFFTNTSTTEVVVDEVLKNSTESGINENQLFKNDKIIAVEGISVDLSGDKTFEDFLKNDVGIAVNSPIFINFTVLPEGSSTPVNRTVKIIPIPKSYVFIGIQSSAYWLSKNWVSSLLGGTFPLWLQKEFLYFFSIAFSVTLFNMLPVPAFDGYRMTSEIVSAVVGSKYERNHKKKVQFYFDPQTAEYPLMTTNATAITDIEMEFPPNANADLVDELKYKSIGKINNEFIDTICFDLVSTKLPPVGTRITATIEYDHDMKSKVKKRINLLIGLAMLAILILNFVFSFLFLGNITFWL
jgi:membrane-associated protease RseP (regulator of RpoE activity)